MTTQKEVTVKYCSLTGLVEREVEGISSNPLPLGALIKNHNESVWQLIHIESYEHSLGITILTHHFKLLKDKHRIYEVGTIMSNQIIPTLSWAPTTAQDEGIHYSELSIPEPYWTGYVWHYEHKRVYQIHWPEPNDHSDNTIAIYTERLPDGMIKPIALSKYDCAPIIPDHVKYIP